MSDASFENLISAYLDDELGPEERAQAEQLIANDADLASLMESMRAHSRQLKSLPLYKLDDQFANQLMDSAAFEDAFAEATGFGTASELASGTTGSKTTLTASTQRAKNWRAAAVAIGSLAALILVTIFVDPTQLVPDPPLAEIAGKNAADEMTQYRENDRTDKFADDSSIRFKGPGSKVGSSDEQDVVSDATPYSQPPLTVNDDSAANEVAGQQKGFNEKAKSISSVNPKLGKSGGVEMQKPSNNQLAVITADAGQGPLAASGVPLEIELANNAVKQKLPAAELFGDSQARLGGQPIPNSQIANALPAAQIDANQFQSMPQIEQFIDVTFPADSNRADSYLGDVRKALADNDIVLANDDAKNMTKKNQAQQMGRMQLGAVEQAEALLIVASRAKMRGVIGELAKTARVSAYGFSAEDQLSFSSNLRNQIASAAAKSRENLKPSESADVARGLSQPMPTPELAKPPESDARPGAADSKIGIRPVEQSAELEEKLGGRRAAKYEFGAAIQDRGLAESLSSAGAAKNPADTPSIAQRFRKKSLFDDLHAGFGVADSAADGQQENRLRVEKGQANREGGNRGGKFDESVAKSGEADYQSDDDAIQPANALPDPEQLFRFLGSTGDDSTPRQYLLFFRQAPGSVVESIQQVAPAMGSKPDSKEK